MRAGSDTDTARAGSQNPVVDHVNARRVKVPALEVVLVVGRVDRHVRLQLNTHQMSWSVRPPASPDPLARKGTQQPARSSSWRPRLARRSIANARPSARSDAPSPAHQGAPRGIRSA